MVFAFCRFDKLWSLFFFNLSQLWSYWFLASNSPFHALLLRAWAGTARDTFLPALSSFQDCWWGCQMQSEKLEEKGMICPLHFTLLFNVFLLRCNWHSTWRCITCWFDTCMCCGMITAVVWAKTPSLHVSIVSFLWWEWLGPCLLATLGLTVQYCL